MRILQLMNFSLEGLKKFVEEGGEYQGHHVYGYLHFDKYDIDVDYLSPNYDNILIRFLVKFTPLKKEHLGLLQMQWKCISKCKEYDLIYSPQDLHLILLSLLRKLKICTKPVYSISHFAYNMSLVKSNNKRTFKKIERFIYYHSMDKISFLNETLLKLAIEDFNVPYRHRTIVNWSADLEFFERYQNTENKTPSNNFFVSIGSTNRDYTTLIRAFKQVDFPLEIIGRKDESLYLNCDVPSNVKFNNSIKPGLSSVAQLRYYYYNSIAVLIPILEDNDVSNGASVFIEALAMGKPIIISDLRTNYIDVEKENIGIKVKRGDIKGWEDAINWVLTHPNEIKTMGENSKRLAREKYNYNIFLGNTINQLKQI